MGLWQWEQEQRGRAQLQRELHAQQEALRAELHTANDHGTPPRTSVLRRLVARLLRR